MSPLPLLHLNPRNSPLKSRPATPIHFQTFPCQSAKPRRSAPEHPNRSKSKSASRSTSANSTRLKHLSKPRDDAQLAAPIQSTPSAPSSARPPNRKSTSKRSRKPREGTTSPQPADEPISCLYNLSFPEPHHLYIDTPDRLINPSPTPRTSDSATKRQVLSLTDFCNQLTAEAHDQPFEVNPSQCSRTSKKKPNNRRSKKGGQRRVPMCPVLSDSEDVLTFDHSIFLSHECLFRSATSSPIKIAESPSTLNGPPLLDDVTLAASPSATKPSGMSGLPPARPSASPASSPTRQHLRAKSVASIFDLEKPQLASKPRSAKDDWDMPPAAPPRGLTWQQKEKKSDKTTLSASTSSHLAQKLAHNDSKSPPGTSVSSISKETLTRRQRTALSRTSSASTLSRPSVATAKPCQSYLSRSDDESAMTWQQSILRPSLRHTLLTSRSDQSVNTSETKSCNKKNAAFTGTKTPVKPACILRKAGITSAVKPRTSGPPPPSNKRRNSLSSPRTSTVKPLEDTPIQEKSRSLGLKSGGNVFSEWKSFTSPASGKCAQPILSNPLPILGAQADHNTPNRRHPKSYTHQPAVKSFMQPSSQPSNSAPILSPTTDPKDMKLLAPSKPRSTSENLYLATPVNKLSSPALRAVFMYAGPQFHNSPCPAALPAPKFSFGSA